MTNEPAQFLAKHLRTLSAAARADRLPDGELLQRFAAQRDEDAFAALVRRHGPMVMSVCRRVLHDVHDAEDVFQAAFLVLSRRTASLRCAESLGCFLHGIAYRLSLKARTQLARQRRRESQAAVEYRAADPLAELTVREAQAIVDEELSRLPEKYRAPLILCCIEGRTRDEAARQLGWSAKLVKSRLEQGRERLRSRLSNRGLTVPAALVATLLAEEAAPVVLTAAMIRSAVQIARTRPAISASIASLAESALGGTITSKAKLVVGLLFLTGILAAGFGALALPQSAKKQAETPTATSTQETPKSETQQPARTDRYGDPLPPGALARLGTLRWRHGDQVMAVAFSPDGKTLASGAQDKIVHLWEVKTGRRLCSFRGHEKEVSCVLFTPDGTRLITLGWDGTTRLWDAASGKELRRWDTPGGWQVALSADGKTLAGFGASQPQHTLYLWDVATGAKIREMPYEGKSDGLVTLAFSPDGKTLVSGGDRELRRWDVASGKQLEVFGTGRGQTHAVVFAPDGKTFAVASHDRATLWDAVSGKEIYKLAERPVYSVAISPDGKRLATGSRTVRLWDTATGKEIRTYKGRHQGRIWSVAFSPDGKTVAGGSEGSSIQLWDADTGEERTSPAGHESWLRFTRFTPDGKSVLTGSWDSWVRRWDIATAKETGSFLVNEDSFCLAYALAPDGRTLAAGSDKAIQLRDAVTGKALRRFADHRQWIADLVLSPSGDRIASVEYGGSAVYLWDVKSGKKLRVIRTPSNCLAFSADGKSLATGGGLDERVMSLWDADTGKLIRRWMAHEQQLEPDGRGISAVAFSADGKLLASAGADRTIRFWDAASGREWGRLQPDRAFFTRRLAFSPDGKMLAAAGDQTVRLWETASGKERRRFQGHAGLVESVAFSADGCLLVSGGVDTSALVWSVWPPVSAAAEAILTLGERDRLWLDLADADASGAWRAMQTLHSHPRSALAVLEAKLHAAARPDEKKIAELIAALDSDRFEVRSRAEMELEELEELAEPALRRVLRDKPSSLEMRRRIEGLLKRLEGPISSPQSLRRLRAIEILEHIGSPEARQMLRTLAGGESQARLTREAKAALDRLARKSNTAP